MPSFQLFNITIFGINGHLSRSKLMPALYNLFIKNHLPKAFMVIGFGRRPLERQEYENLLTEYFPDTSDARASEFLRHCHYFEGVFEDASSYQRLKSLLSELEAREGKPCHRLYYLATSPNYFELISQHLGDVGLALPALGHPPPALLIEKPFGYDLASAEQLETVLRQTFNENQLYHIDHYLGKQSVRCLKEEPSANWNSSTVDHIQIILAEDEGIGTRGGYYDETGALRDVVQNHALQMLALLTMEKESITSVNDERMRRAAAISTTIIETIITGQYEGYLREDKVETHSSTETFVALKAHLGSSRWKNTPIYILTGKRLKQKLTQVTIVFKDQGSVTIRLQPNPQKVVLQPANQPVTEPYIYDSLEPHEQLILDVLHGDQTFFVHEEEIRAQWEVVGPVLSKLPTPLSYQANSWGPLAAFDLIKADGREWRLP